MFFGDDVLATERRRLIAEFGERASKARVELNPLGAERDLNLEDRIFWERASDREFVIELSEHSLSSPDAFTKRTGLNDDVELLYVFVPLAPRFDDDLWELYLAWIHERVSEELMSARIDKFDPYPAS